MENIITKLNHNTKLLKIPHKKQFQLQLSSLETDSDIGDLQRSALRKLTIKDFGLVCRLAVNTVVLIHIYLVENY